MAITIIRNGINGTTASAPNLTGQAGSLITVLDFCLVTTLGWTKSFSGTNLASYRQPTGSNQFYLGVDDTGTTQGRVRGFESMTAAGVAVGSGTSPFPTDAQLSGGGYVYKSASADVTARSWYFISDGKRFYLYIQPGGATTGDGFFFGDFKSYKGSDAYNTALIANNTTGSVYAIFSATTSVFNASNGHYIARSYSQTGGSVATGKMGNPAINNSNALGGAGSGAPTYPAPIEGGLLMSPCYLHETTNAGIRGELPGLWAPLHGNPLNHLDTFSGSGSLSGKTFEVLTIGGASNGQVFFETSNTWST